MSMMASLTTRGIMRSLSGKTPSDVAKSFRHLGNFAVSDDLTLLSISRRPDIQSSELKYILKYCI